MTKMRVLLVDDMEDEVRVITDIFANHPLVALDHVSKYADLGSADEDYVRAVDEYDLLVLDILMDRDQQPFLRFVGAIAGRKPFLAYTQLRGDDDLDLASGAVEIHKWVATKGGMGVITKSFSPVGPERSVQYDIADAVLSFYWNTR
jgi:CheY-like chemotaxis protein